MIIEGKIVRGKQLGRTIGFPTANIESERQIGEIPDGVYAALVEIDAIQYRAMVNIGCHPTLPEGERTIEAHIFDFDGDLYGKMMRIEIIAFIRPERKFASADALRQQLSQDKLTAMEVLELR